MYRIAFLALLGLSAAGCGTIYNLGHDGLGEPFGGTILNAQMIGSGDDAILGSLDFPFSAAADAVTLPYTIPYTIAGLFSE